MFKKRHDTHQPGSFTTTAIVRIGIAGPWLVACWWKGTTGVMKHDRS
jgi:hypothetical protein